MEIRHLLTRVGAIRAARRGGTALLPAQLVVSLLLRPQLTWLELRDHVRAAPGGRAWLTAARDVRA